MMLKRAGVCLLLLLSSALSFSGRPAWGGQVQCCPGPSSQSMSTKGAICILHFVVEFEQWVVCAFVVHVLATSSGAAAVALCTSKYHSNMFGRFGGRDLSGAVTTTNGHSKCWYSYVVAAFAGVAVWRSDDCTREAAELKIQTPYDRRALRVRVKVHEYEYTVA